MTGFDKLLIECDNNFNYYTKHLEELRNNIALQDDAKSLLLSINPKADITDFIEAEHFNNYNGYVTISILELSVNLKNLILSKSEWEKIFFIKNSFLIIHETTNKLYPSKGKSYIQLTIENKYPSLKDQFYDIVNDIENFKKNVDYKKIEDTRHFTAGHIEKSLRTYYDTIIKLNGDEAGQYINDYLSFLHKALSLTKDYAILATSKQEEKAKNQSEELDRVLKQLLKMMKD